MPRTPLSSQAAFPLRARSESVRRDRSLDGKNSVKVIDLVLEQFRQVSLGIQSLEGAPIVLILNSNLGRSRDAHQ